MTERCVEREQEVRVQQWDTEPNADRRCKNNVCRRDVKEVGVMLREGGTVGSDER